MDMSEKTLASEVLFEGKIITLRRDTVLLPNGKEATRGVVEHPGGVAIVPVDDAGNVLMVRQYRRPFDRLVLELPAGKLNYGEDHRACGIRELEEETGMKAKQFTYMGAFYPTPGFCQEIIHLYLATGLYAGTVHLDEDEFLEVERYPFADVVEMVMRGELQDAKSAIGILKAKELFARQAVRLREEGR